MRHYTEIELLEQYYLGSVSPGLADHVNGCEECSMRFRRLAEKMSCSAKAHSQRVEDKPGAFWGRQRANVAAAIAQRRRAAPVSRWRLAIVTALVVLTAGAVYLTVNDSTPAPAVVQRQNTPAAEAVAAVLVEENAEDAWESEQLEPYGEMVEWESWLSETQKEGTS